MTSTVSLTFNQPTVSDITAIFAHNDAIYSVHNENKTAIVHRLPERTLVGKIELHSLTSNVVTTKDGRSIRPSTSSSLGFGSSKFTASDGSSYSWSWKSHVGWRLRNSRDQDIAQLVPGPSNLPVLHFTSSSNPQVQDEIVLTVLYMELSRSDFARAKGVQTSVPFCAAVESGAGEGWYAA